MAGMDWWYPRLWPFALITGLVWSLEQPVLKVPSELFPININGTQWYPSRYVPEGGSKDGSKVANSKQPQVSHPAINGQEDANNIPGHYADGYLDTLTLHWTKQTKAGKNGKLYVFTGFQPSEGSKGEPSTLLNVISPANNGQEDRNSMPQRYADGYLDTLHTLQRKKQTPEVTNATDFAGSHPSEGSKFEPLIPSKASPPVIKGQEDTSTTPSILELPPFKPMKNSSTTGTNRPDEISQMSTPVNSMKKNEMSQASTPLTTRKKIRCKLPRRLVQLKNGLRCVNCRQGRQWTKVGESWRCTELPPASPIDKSERNSFPLQPNPSGQPFQQV